MNPGDNPVGCHWAAPGDMVRDDNNDDNKRHNNNNNHNINQTMGSILDDVNVVVCRHRPEPEDKEDTPHDSHRQLVDHVRSHDCGDDEESQDYESYDEEDSDCDASQSQSGSYFDDDDNDEDCSSTDSDWSGPAGMRGKEPLFGMDGEITVLEEFAEATWHDVWETCCVHSTAEWLLIITGLAVAVFFLYFFLFGLELLGVSARVVSGCDAGKLFNDDTNPIAGVMIGILATSMLQSSSTTTSIVVTLVGSTITVSQGIYMIMGANIGTSITNTIVAMGQMGNVDQFERAFAGATVHDMFNFLSVAILLPTELVTGYLARLTGALVKNIETGQDQAWEGPVKKYVAPLSERIIRYNRNLISAVAQGTGSCKYGDGFYPIVCEPGTPTAKTCSQVGLISCSSRTNKCPAFFQATASAHDDRVSGGVMFFFALCILFICLIAFIAVLQRLLLGISTRIIFKATDLNGYLGIAIGCGITILVQSSTITTSTLTPLVGIGAIRLEQMFHLTIGANLGTPVTAIMASMVTEGKGSLQVAMAHFFFNVTGALIFYPLPFFRRIPLTLCTKLGQATRVWRGFAIVYLVVMFFTVPLIFLGLSFFFESGTIGSTILGIFLTVSLSLILFWSVYKFHCRGGKQHCLECMANRERRRKTIHALPDDIEYLKRKLTLLLEHTGLPDENCDEEKDCLRQHNSFINNLLEETENATSSSRTNEPAASNSEVSMTSKTNRNHDGNSPLIEL